MSDDEHSANQPVRTELPGTVHLNGAQAARYSAEFSGPLPPPSILYDYERACSGAADRIIRMAEQEAEHRRLTETAIVRAGTEDLERASADSKRGQVFALAIVIASIGGCVYLALNGHEWAGRGAWTWTAEFRGGSSFLEGAGTTRHSRKIQVHWRRQASRAAARRSQDLRCELSSRGKRLLLPDKAHLATLDGLRGMAALLVMLHHSIDPYGTSPIRAGLAVDFFFLLSGFVIAYAYEGKLLSNKLSAWSFFSIRVIRLYPLAFLGFACGVFVFVMKSFAAHQPLGWRFLVSVLCGSVVVPSPARLALGWASAFPFNPPSWSLFFEFFINIVYVRIVHRLTRGTLAWVLVVSGVALLLQEIFAGGMTGNWNTLYLGFGRVTFPFFLGMFLFHLEPRKNERRLKGGAVLVSALLLAALLFPATKFDVVLEIATGFVVFPVIVFLGAASEPPAWAK